jgi:hypothetical protein
LPAQSAERRRSAWGDDVQYEIVYDVLDDGYHVLGWEWVGIRLGGVMLALWACVLHSHRWRLTGYPSRGNPWVAFLVVGLIEIVERGAAVNACWAGLTPLDHALAYNREEIAAYLRSAGGKRAGELGQGE